MIDQSTYVPLPEGPLQQALLDHIEGLLQQTVTAKGEAIEQGRTPQGLSGLDRRNIKLSAGVRAAQDAARRAERAARRGTQESRAAIFWAGVSKTAECWLWAGETDRNGYGQARWAGRRIPAHRVSWMLSHGGAAPARVRHLCENRACVRPDHLASSR